MPNQTGDLSVEGGQPMEGRNCLRAVISSTMSTVTVGRPGRPSANRLTAKASVPVAALIRCHVAPSGPPHPPSVTFVRSRDLASDEDVAGAQVGAATLLARAARNQLCA